MHPTFADRTPLRNNLSQLAQVQLDLAEAENCELFGRFSRRCRQLLKEKARLQEEIIGSINDLLMDVDAANRAYDRLMASFDYSSRMDDDGYLHFTSSGDEEPKGHDASQNTNPAFTSDLSIVDYDYYTGLAVTRVKNGLSLLA